jgi:N utilization substance protein A
MKGMRVQSIIRELRGEKIDIIEFSDDPVVFATHALSPAKISRVAVVSAAEKHMEVIVDDTQLSLAIGKKGQNVRLAAKLLGWKIDIKSEEEKRQEVETAMAALAPAGAPVYVLADHGLPEEIVEKLIAGGVGTVEKLGSMTPEELEALPGIGEQVIEKILFAVNAYYGEFDAGEQEQPVEGEEVAPADSEVEAVAEGNGLDVPHQHIEHGPEGDVEVVDAADVHLSNAPSELSDSPHPFSSVAKGEFDTIKDSENAS